MHKFLFVLSVAAGGGFLAWTQAWPSLGPAFEGSAEAGPPENAPELAPEFPEETEWVQSKPLKMANLRGKVAIVHFWTFGCINCIHNYPVYKSWQEKYAGNELTIIGVHTPEFDRETDVSRVRTKARDNRLKFSIAIDNDKRIWKTWNNHYWPSTYLVDKKGRVRYHWDGELDPRRAEGRQFAARIDELLNEKP